MSEPTNPIESLRQMQRTESAAREQTLNNRTISLEHRQALMQAEKQLAAEKAEKRREGIKPPPTIAAPKPVGGWLLVKRALLG